MTARPIRKASGTGLTVITGRRRFSPLILFPWLVYVLLIAVAFIGLAYAQTSMNEGAVVLQDIRRDIAIEESRASALRLEIARLRAPDRIILEATALGMSTPTVPLRTVDAVGVRYPKVSSVSPIENGPGAGVPNEVANAAEVDPPVSSDG